MQSHTLTRRAFGFQLALLPLLQLIMSALANIGSGFDGGDTLQAVLSVILFFSSLVSLLALITWFRWPILGWQLHVMAMILAILSSLIMSPIYLLALYFSVKNKNQLLSKPDPIT